jgi:uncharacterized protein (DUF58 family)
MEEQEYGVPTLFIIPLVQVFVAALLFVSLLYRQRDLAMLTILVLGIVTGVRLWTRISLSGLTSHSTVSKQKLFPDEKLVLAIKSENKKFLPIWLQVIVPIRGLADVVARHKVLKKESGLLWYQRTRFEWELNANRRGVHQIGPPIVLAGDLFAFFNRQKRMSQSHEIIVYPRLVPLKPFSLPRRDFFGIPGPRAPVQDPVYILGTRDYQPGQAAKYIHWKASARHDRLQEKVLESTQQEKALLVLDVQQFARSNAEEAFERTIEVMASLAVSLDRKGHAVGWISNGVAAGGILSSVSIARNSRQLSALLEGMARVQLKSQGPLIEIMRRTAILNWGVSCVHFSYEEDDSLRLVQQYFRRCKVPATCCVFRSSEGGENVRRTDDLLVGKGDVR